MSDPVTAGKATYTYAGSDWIATDARRTLSPLGILVADILGQVYHGIYHIRKAVLHPRVEWDNPELITLVINRELANHDSPDLTRMVLLCHEAGVRLGITAAAYRYLRLDFSAYKMLWTSVDTVTEIVEKHAAYALANRSSFQRATQPGKGIPCMIP